MQVATSFLFWMNTIAPFDLEVTSTQGILWNPSHDDQVPGVHHPHQEEKREKWSKMDSNAALQVNKRNQWK